MVVNFFEAVSKILKSALDYFLWAAPQAFHAFFSKFISSLFLTVFGLPVKYDDGKIVLITQQEGEPSALEKAIGDGTKYAMKTISDVAGDTAKGLIGVAFNVVDDVKEDFTAYLTPFADEFVDAILPGSPEDKRVDEFGKKISEGFLQALEKMRPKAKSKVTFEQARNSAALYLGSNVTMNLVTRLIGSGIDVVHPYKELGIHKIIDGIWWGLGLNWLTWVALGPFMQSYIAKPMARHFRQEFSESDLSVSDVLKLYKIGYYSREKTIEKLNYLGYDEEDTAAKLVLISQEESETEKQLSVSTILKALKLGYISEEDAIQRLTDKGYLDSDIELWIKVTLHEKDNEGRDLTRSQILRFYSEGILTLEETQQELDSMGYSESEIARMIELEDLKNYPNRKYLTKAEVIEYLKKGWMDEEEAKINWYVQGYTDYEIQFYLKEAK